MSRDVSGLWAPTANSFYPAAVGTVIDPDDWNTFVTDLYNEMNSAKRAILTADYTLTDQNTAQKAFNVSSNGTITLAASTTYMMRAQYLITNTGTNAHTWAVLFALGTATLTTAMMTVRGRSGATSLATLAADSSNSTTDITTALVATASSTSSTENVILTLTGIIRIATGGTITPQVKLSATTGGTLKMLANSFIEFVPVGTNSFAAMGTWS